MGAGKPPIWAVVKAHFRASPGKSALMGVLFVVMIVVYVRMFASGPSQAADAELMAPVSAAEPPSNPSIGAQPANVPSERVELAEPLTRELERDPFLVNADQQTGLSVSSSVPVAGSDEVELVLQSTICGDHPMAVISGRLLRPGDAILGCVLGRVEPTRVWLTRNGVRKELKLKLWAESSDSFGFGR